MFFINCNYLILTISVFVFNQMTLNFVASLPVDAVENFDVLKPYSEEEIQCLSEEKFFFNGSCELLNTRASCAEGETLVLNEGSNESIEPICQKNKCPDEDVWHTSTWWPSEKRCVPVSDIIKNYCKSDLNLTYSLDNFGNGQCICYPWKGSFEGSDVCYEFYQRGPCKINQVVTYDALTGHAFCSKDLCFDLNHPTYMRKSSNESDSEEKLYGPFQGTGPCYKFGELDICESKYYTVLFEKHHAPDCVPPAVPAVAIDGAPLCKVDKTTGKCREEDKLNTNDDRQNKPYAKAFLCRALRNRGTGKSMLKGC